MPALFAASIIFLSLIEPPGWMIALMPTFINSWIPSGKGKKASDAATEPIIFLGKNCNALLDAILQLSNLFGCPEPMPIVDLLFAKMMALDFTNLQILKANLRLLSWFVDGFFLVTTRNFFLSKSVLFDSWAKKEFLKKR